MIEVSERLGLYWPYNIPFPRLCSVVVITPDFEASRVIEQCLLVTPVRSRARPDFFILFC